jgi:hypothetical protein
MAASVIYAKPPNAIEHKNIIKTAFPDFPLFSFMTRLLSIFEFFEPIFPATLPNAFLSYSPPPSSSPVALVIANLV